MSEPSPFAAYPTPFSQQPSPLRSVRGIGWAAMVLIVIEAVVSIVTTAKAWSAYNVANGYEQGTGPTKDDVVSAGLGLLGLGVLLIVAALAAGIVFLVWAWRARVNAESLAGPDSQRLRRGWTFWGWVCPIVNLWFPYQIMVDIYRASSVRKPATTAIVGVWWVAMLLNELGQFAVRVTQSGNDVVQSLHDDATWQTIGAVCEVAAAVLIVLIIRQVSEWQDPHRAQRDAAPGPVVM